MDAVLYALPASHPCAAVERALVLKGIPYRRVELIPGAHRIAMRLRFGERTVPAVAFPDGGRVVGSRALMRALDARVPEPRLVRGGADAARAEEWGDEVLQPLTRRVVWAALVRAPEHVMPYTEDAELPVPRRLASATAPLTARLAASLNDAGDANVRADLLALPGHLDRIDRWIGEGLLPAGPPSAAALQIAASVGLLRTVGDVRALIDARPAGGLARALFPDYPGDVPAGALPRDWL